MFRLTMKEQESNPSLDFEEVDWLIRMEQDKNWDEIWQDWMCSLNWSIHVLINLMTLPIFVPVFLSFMYKEYYTQQVTSKTLGFPLIELLLFSLDAINSILHLDDHVGVLGTHTWC